MPQGSLILNKDQAAKKIDRIAYQIWENNSKEKDIVLAGISVRGYKLAGILAKKLESISGLNVILVEIVVNKKKSNGRRGED